MSQEKNENTYTAPNRQVQKSPKEKTMATGHTNSLATIDITQATTLEEQALIIQNNLENANSPAVSVDNFANYYPGKYWKNKTNLGETKSDDKTYIVKAGESISAIAKKHGISKETLINANLDKIHGTRVKYFIAGDLIIIPDNDIKVVDKEKVVADNSELNEIKKEEQQPNIEVAESETNTSEVSEIKEKPALNESLVPESEKKKDGSPEEKEEKTGYITSYVGDYVTNVKKERIANLGKDVAFVQEHLNRLGILSDADYLSEKPVTEEEINKSTIPKTIEAIRYFQEQIISLKSVDGAVWPGRFTIKSLVPMTVEQKDAKHLAYLEKKKQEKKEAEDKAKAEKEAKINAEKKAKAKEAEEKKKKEIEQIEPPGYFGVQAYWLEFLSFEKFGKFLKDYALYNPKFVIAVYKYTDFYLTDDLTIAILNLLSESEIANLSDEIDQLFYDTIKWGDVTEKEKAFMAKLKAGYKKDDVKVDEKTLGDANADLKTLRKTLNYNLSGSVGKNGLNYVIDVKQIAEKLKEKKYDISDDSIKKGKCDEKLIKAIYTFQKDIVKLTGKNLDSTISIGGGTFKKLYSVNGKYKSGIKDIHAGRTTVNLNLVNSDGKGIKEAVGDANDKTYGGKVKNNFEDVKYVSQLLKNKGYTVTNKSLIEGKWDATFIAAIKAFEKSRGKTQFGVVTNDGGNIKALQATSLSIGKLTYANGVHDKNNTSTEAKAYYDKLDVLEKNLKIEDDKDNAKILSIARKAATDNSYFAALTKDVSAKLSLTEQNVRDNGFSLSPVLVDRMRRFHKFLSAAGLFKGDMTSTEGGGVRSELTAHIWCGQWIIAGEAAGSDSGSTYIAATKKIMLEMYNEQKSNSSKFIVDTDTNKWAKKEHFTEKDGKVTMDWAKIKSYVVDIEGGRGGYTSPANSGYKENTENRKPVPSTFPPRTNHRTGEALDINATAGFQNKYDSILDMIALNFGVVRAGGRKEWWHFELTDIKLSAEEKKIEKNKTYPKLIGEK